MRGCITKRKNSWAFVIDIGKHPETGRRRQKWKSGFATRKEAEIALTNALAEMGRVGEYVEPSNELFGDYIQDWLKMRKNQVRPSTWKGFRWLVNNYIIPKLGMIPISKLAPFQIQNFYSELHDQLSTQSIVHIHRIVKSSLETAMNWGKIQKNAAKLVSPPRIKHEKFSVWDEIQLRKFLETCKFHRLYIVFLLAASTGMRQGEILGLRWSDVSIEKATLAVRQALTRSHNGFAIQETKTASSVRTIAIPPNVIEDLRTHKIRQLEERLSTQNYNDHGLVVQSMVGTPLSPRNLARTWYKLLEKSCVPKIRFHDLRHTHATLLLKQGIHPKIVSERLGHSSVQITLDTYSHLLPNMQEAAARSFGELLEGSNEQAQGQ